MYAFNNQYPIFFSETKRPFAFEYFKPDVNLSYLQLPTEPKSLTTFGDVKIVGHPKELLWERLLFLLSLDGNVPLSNLCTSMRYDGEKITCSNQYSKIAAVNFEKCIYFDGDVANLDITKSLANDHHVCYDWVAFHKGGMHEIDYLSTGDKFVSEVWFYPSDRIDGNTKVKDACIKSIVESAAATDFNFSETMARFKLVHEMESRGMKGTFNGYSKTGRPKYYKHKTSNIRREICEPKYECSSNSDKIEIGEKSEQSLLQDLSSSCLAYNRFLSNYEEHTLSWHNTASQS